MERHRRTNITFEADAFMKLTLSVLLKIGLSKRLTTYLPEQAC